MREDGTYFDDHQVHKVLDESGYENAGGEWYKISVKDLKAAIIAVKENELSIDLNRTKNFSLRPD